MRFGKSGVAGFILAAGCGTGGGGTGGGSFALTAEELAAGLGDGARIEVTLRADGTVREVELENEGPGHQEQLAGQVVRIEGDTLEVQYLGAVDFQAADRFRTPEASSVDRSAWLTAMGAQLAAGGSVFIDARGRFGQGGFAATEVRWEDEGRTKIEADVQGAALDEAAGTLTVAGIEFSLGNAALRRDDGNDEVESGDDHGDDGVEIGDDHGNPGPGGDDEVEDETGDDHGNPGPGGDDEVEDEAGDDHGDDGAEDEQEDEPEDESGHGGRGGDDD